MMNNLNLRKGIIVFVVAITISGCSHWNELSRKHQGAEIGAGTGAVIGSIVAGPVGTVVGGASGTLAGGVIAVETR